MRVLIVSSEVFPLIKTGGLADVAGALPPALAARGVDARILMPAYPLALQKLGKPLGTIDLGILPGFGGTRLIVGTMPDSQVPVWLVDNPSLYERAGGPYQRPDGGDHDDNFRRFALLSKVAVLVATGQAVPNWSADIVHTNDWQTGLVPAYLKLQGFSRPKSVFTIHNLHFPGIFGPEILSMVGLPPECFSMHGLEFNGKVSYLKAGLYYADRLTTVSPTYAWEITTAEGGRGLEGLLAARAHSKHLTGVLNGVDYDLWSPASDKYIPFPYTAQTVAEGKAANKAALQEKMGLDLLPNAPLLGLVSRFSDQKGVDLVVAAAGQMVAAGAQLLFVGMGDPGLEHAVRRLAEQYPGRVACEIGYNEPLAHQVEAGSDIFLVPSRFEPCGLTQLYALRFGALPLVRRTGGLADTVLDTIDGVAGTGFLFDTPTSDGLLGAFYRALDLYRSPDEWHYARQRAMAQDFGWDRAADSFLRLYEEALTS